MSETIVVKFKRLSADAIVPTKANPSDSGFDLTALGNPEVGSEGYLEYDTGIAVAPPPGYYFELFPRSSISKYDLALCNSVGIIDQGYRNSIKVRFRTTHKIGDAKIYKNGDKIAQLILKKLEPVSLIEVESLDETDRNLSGFGSSGN